MYILKLLHEVKAVKKIKQAKHTREIIYPERIRGLRQDNDLSQKTVAGILKVAQNTYSQYELYRRPMPIEHLMTLCEFYHVSADYILGFSDDKNFRT